MFKRTRRESEGEILKVWDGQTLSKKQTKAFSVSNGMNKQIFWSIINGALMLPFLANADGEIPPPTALKNPLIGTDTFEQLIEAISKAAMQIGLPIAALFIIYSGFLFIKAQGNEEDLKKAKTTFFWSMIGTLVLLGAWTIAKAISGTVKSLQ